MFTKDEVKIFKYWDGEKYRCVDPIEIQINLEGHEFGENLEELFKAVQAGDVKALKDVIDIGRVMFDLKEMEYDEENDKTTGTSSQGVISIMVDFISYMDDLKKNIDDMQTFVPSMDTQPKGVTLPTNASSECGSTSEDKCCDKPSQ